MLGSELGEQTALIHGVGEGLLAIDMLAGSDGVGRDDGMRMVGRTAHDGIRLGEHLVVHDAPVVVAFGIRITFKDGLCVLPVGIAQADDVLGLHLAEVGGTTATDTYTEDVQLVAGSFFLTAGFAQNCARHYCEADGSSGSLFQEVAA